MSKNSSNSIISFFVGLLLGGVFGVLFAPDRGNNTRDRLTYRLNKYKLRIQDLLEEILEDKEIKKSDNQESLLKNMQRLVMQNTYFPMKDILNI